MPRKPLIQLPSWGGIVEVVPDKKYRIRYRADVGDGRGYMRHSETFYGTAKQAVHRKNVLEATYGGDKSHRRVPTVREIWENDVRDELIPTLSRRSADQYNRIWTREINPKWGNKRLDSLIGADVKTWLRNDLKPSIANKALSIMRHITRQGYALGHIQRDPLDFAISIEKKARGKGTTQRAIRDAMPYWDVLRDTPYEAAFLIIVGAGTRSGEAGGVLVDDVWRNEDGNVTIVIRDEVNELGQLEGRLKNEHSYRLCAIAGTMADRLIELRDKARERGWTFLSQTRLGHPRGTTAFRHAIEKLMKDAGLEYVDPRSMRPSFSTAMLTVGGENVSPQDVNRLMGHVPESKVLYTNYFRPTEDASLGAILPVWDKLGQNAGKDQVD